MSGYRRCVDVTMGARRDLYKMYHSYPNPNPLSNPDTNPKLDPNPKPNPNSHPILE